MKIEHAGMDVFPCPDVVIFKLESWGTSRIARYFTQNKQCKVNRIPFSYKYMVQLTHVRDT